MLLQHIFAAGVYSHPNLAIIMAKDGVSLEPGLALGPTVGSSSRSLVPLADPRQDSLSAKKSETYYVKKAMNQTW
jgi:hypothetical protein